MLATLLPVLLLFSGLLTAAAVIFAVRGFFRRFAARRPAPAPLPADLGGFEGAGAPSSALARRLLPLARRLRPQNEAELAGLRLKLAQAGLAAQGAVDQFVLIQLLSLFAAGLLAVPWFLIGEPGLLLIGLAACAAVGFLLPRFWLSLRISSRREQIGGSLASTLDLLVTCMEAGLGLEQALDRVATELQLSERAMAEELLLTINEMRAGIPTAEAFRKLSARVGLEEMHMLCSVIIQSSTLGASIGQMLRQYAASWRQQRMMDLEEKAGKMTAALTLPLTLCLLPSAILAMLGPAVIVVMQNLG